MLENCFAMEIYNHGSEIVGYYGYTPQVYDEILRTGKKIHCLSTDDNHNRNPLDGRESDSFGGWINISSADLTYDNIIKSLIDGDFYSSQGPEIYGICLEDAGGVKKLTVKCSDVDLIVVYTNGRRCYIKKSPVEGSPINEATFEINGDDKYIRVMCRDINNKDANSNAYWL
jgi:hypothetical protein